MYEVKDLSEVPFSDITACMRKAFSDYYVKMELGDEALNHRFTGENVRYDLSCGVFVEEELVALLLNAVGEYNGEKVAFDAATGVVPKHRRKGLYTKMMDFCMVLLRQQDFAYYGLEVIQTNEPAVVTYRKMGLEVVKEYACFRGNARKSAQGTSSFREQAILEFPLEKLESLMYDTPSFENRSEVIQAFPEDYLVMYTGTPENCDAFILYQKNNGHIKQWGRKEGELTRLGQLIVNLSRRFQDIRLHNITFADQALIEHLEELGFNHFCDQYEMKMDC
ncbi:GNAT family N-acetyltransferase [Enterococcus sp.]|uniref:GNAT family N-acetyltransferase n=1 Tax=Enterococcus sp. TaxID=35783 RepID=UPI002912E8AC|nr:GNAT family N-acetyltransferase [Enterococcus sp.]MDU5333398.1 GNAT family N-acetyltransferase [Enterococcus sp.]